MSLSGYFRHSMAANSVVGGPIWLKFKLIKDIIDFLVTCKYKKDQINSKRDFSDTKGQLTPYSVVGYVKNSNSSKLLCMSSLPTRMKVKSKMKALSRVATTFLLIVSTCIWGFFFRCSKAANSAGRGLIWTTFVLTREFMVVSLPARMKKIQSKKVLEWSQHFLHYNPMVVICCHGEQSSDPIWLKT